MASIDSGDVLVTSDHLNSPTESIDRTLGAGRYFVRVMGINGATNYTLNSRFSANDGDDTLAESHPLAIGHFIDMTMQARDDVDMVKFTVVAGQRASRSTSTRGTGRISTPSCDCSRPTARNWP